MEKLKINFGPNQFVVDPNTYSYDRVAELAEKVADIRRKNSLFAKYPLEEGESREKWRERIEPLMEKDMLRQEGESADDHLKRLFEAKVDTHEIAFEVVGAIADTFQLRAPTKEDFRAANWLKTRKFIYDVLNIGDIPCDDFYPKRPSAEI